MARGRQRHHPWQEVPNAFDLWVDQPGRLLVRSKEESAVAIGNRWSQRDLFLFPTLPPVDAAQGGSVISGVLWAQSLHLL
jgi:hypothetical protein